MKESNHKQFATLNKRINELENTIDEKICKKFDQKEEEIKRSIEESIQSKMQSQISSEIDKLMKDKLELNQIEIETKVTASINSSLGKIVEDHVNKYFEGNRQIEDTITTLVEEKINQSLHKIDDKDDKLPTLIHQILDDKLSSRQSTPSKSLSNLSQVSPTTYMRTTVTNVTKELKEKEKRRKMFIVYGIPESTSTDNKTEDTTKLLSILNDTLEIPATPTDITDIYRIGRNVNTDPSKPKPLLVTVQNTPLKDCIFRNLHKLKGNKKLSFNHDLTKLEREEHRRLVGEAINLTKTTKRGLSSG